jgi:hypothetical protein
MERPARTWSICAALLAVSIGTSAATLPLHSDVQAVSALPKDVGTLTVLITPATSVPAHTFCHWTATPSGGTGPYHYEWTVNNSPVGDDNSVLAYTNNGSAFRVFVTVTDATTAQATDSKIITIGGSCF